MPNHHYHARFRFLLLPSLLALIFLVSACEDSVVDPPPGVEPPVDVSAAFTIEPQTPRPGEEVTLDGSASSAGGAPISYAWALSTPDGSSAELENPGAETTTFVADVPGVYEVTLEVTAEGESDSTVDEVEVTDAVVEELSGTISSDRTLVSDVLYRVTGSVSVTGGTLTIEPGTVLQFEQGTSIRFADGSAIVANGTEVDPILLTATQETPGWWEGVYLENTRHPNNIFNHVTIEYGGGGDGFHSSTEPANLVIGRNLGRESHVTVTNSTLRHSARYGLYMHAGSRITNAENNTFTQNANGPAAIYADGIASFDGSSSFDGNLSGNDFVLVASTSIADDVTWPAIGVPYRMHGETSVDARLTIEPGATFAFDFEAGLVFGSDAVIRAEGTESEPIVFTGSQETPGWWSGIWVEDSTHPDNVMEYVVVEYGGGSTFHSSVSAANLVLGRNLGRQARLVLRNSTFRHSGGFGLHVDSGSDLPDSGSNTYSLNADGAVSISASGAHYLDSASDFTGNMDDNDFVLVSGNDVDDDATWQALNVPYRMEDGTTVNAEFTIDAGTTFAFTREAGLTFSDGSLVRAIGTDSDPIVFTGTQAQSGWWRGIWLEDTPNPDNVLSNVVIEYGGSAAYHSSTQPANLVLGRNLGRTSRLELTDAVLRHSGGDGLFVHADSHVNADACEANTFSDNDGDDCTLP